MFRALGVAVALAMTPASASAQDSSGPQLPPGWEFIQLRGWTYIQPGNDYIVLMMAARQPNHIWVRYETKSASSASTFRSWKELIEVDCNGWRIRAVESDIFSEHNLEGLIVRPYQEGRWMVPTPNTTGELPLLGLCE